MNNIDYSFFDNTKKVYKHIIKNVSMSNGINLSDCEIDKIWNIVKSKVGISEKMILNAIKGIKNDK